MRKFISWKNNHNLKSILLVMLIIATVVSTTCLSAAVELNENIEEISTEGTEVEETEVEGTEVEGIEAEEIVEDTTEETDIATMSLIAEDAGNYSLTLPDEAEETYTIRFAIVRKFDDGAYVYSDSDEVYYVLVEYADGTKNEELSAYYQFVYAYNSSHEHPEVSLELSGVEAGSKITIENIKIEKNEYDEWGTPLWSNYSLTYMETYVTNEHSDNANVVLIDDEDTLKQLYVGQTVEQTAKLVEQEDSSFVRTTEDTLLTVHNDLYDTSFSSYTGTEFLTHLLSTYNVISLDEINSTHIVGPIISQNTAERTQEEGAQASYLAASDYSNGVPSYVGDFTYYGSEGSETVGVQINYGFDFIENTSFQAPYLYSDESDLKIETFGDSNNLKDRYILTKYENVEVLSANNSGMTETYQNDEFIDFSALEYALQASSLAILESGNAEDYDEVVVYEFDSGTAGTVAGSEIKVYENGDLVKTITSTNGASYNGRYFSDFVSYATYVYSDGTGIRLTINMEESWTIVNAVNLEEVNMILPDGYDYYDNPYLGPTTINFKCTYINPAVYNIDVDGDGTTESVTHSRMPYTLINGTEFTASLGADGEYSEIGNKIIWNMPNVVTNSVTGDNRLTVLDRSHNIAGHILAPSAEFWNYDEDGDWLGGNINGSVIVKSFYSGIAEMHMWAYNGLAEQAVVYGVKAQKTLDGETSTHEFSFILDVEYDEYGNIPDGIMNTVFPMTATSETEGTDAGIVKFSSLVFNEVGTYTFYLTEDTSMDTATDNIIYDLTKYKLVIEVKSTTVDETISYYISSITKYKVADEDGNEMSQEQLYVKTFSTYNALEEYDTGLVFTFDNTTTDADSVNLTLHKQNTTGHVLSGAKFYITEMNEDGTEVLTTGYFESVTSESDGSIHILGLQKGTYYKIQEYEAPYGYVLGEGYWIIYIAEDGYLSSIEAVDGAKEVGPDLVITNESDAWSLLDLTLTKSNNQLETLSGVSFRLQRVIITSEGVPEVVVGGLDEVYISGEDGTFTIEGLEANHIYMLTETSTPENHKTETGYWLIEVSGNALFPSDPLTYTITKYNSKNQVESVITDDIIINEVIDFLLPNTGGMGTQKYYILGAVLLIVSACFMGIQGIRNKRKRAK